MPTVARKVKKKRAKLKRPGDELTTLNIPISEGGTNSSHTHNLVKSQSYRWLKLLLSDSESMTTMKVFAD